MSRRSACVECGNDDPREGYTVCGDCQECGCNKFQGCPICCPELWATQPTQGVVTQES